MKTLFVHAGSPKTGTSAIQKFLMNNQQQLIECGYLYPNLLDGNREGHSNVFMGNAASLAFCMLDDTNEFKLSEEASVRIWSDLDLCLSNVVEDNVILSSEWFFASDKAGLNKLKRVATKNDFQIRVLFWLRPQWEFFYASFAQHLKIDSNYFSSLQNYLDHYLADENQRYLVTLLKFADVFGKENLNVFLYQKNEIAKEDICSKFLTAIGIDNIEIFEFLENFLNVTPSWSELNFLLKGTRHATKESRSPYFGEFFCRSAVSVREDGDDLGGNIPQEFMKQIKEHFAIENKKIEELFFSEGQFFDLNEGIAPDGGNDLPTSDRRDAILLSMISALDNKTRMLENKLDGLEEYVSNVLAQDQNQTTQQITPSVGQAGNKVIVGKNGHLFLGGEDANSIVDQISGALSLGHNDLVIWAANLKHRAELARKYNFQYINFICPEPHIFNFSDLPSGSLVSGWRPISVLSGLFPEDFVYPLKEIRELSSSPNLAYQKTDSHWSPVGGFAGYQVAMKNFGLDDDILSPDELVISIDTVVADLGGKMQPPVWGAVQDLKVKNVQFELKFCNNLSNHGHVKHYSNPKKENKLLIFGTSFSTAWIDFFAASFNEVLYLYSTTSDDFLIQEFRPNFVLYEMPERFIRSPQSENIGFPLLYSLFAKGMDDPFLTENAPVGISLVLHELHLKFAEERTHAFDSMPVAKHIHEFLLLSENNWMFLRDSRYSAHQNISIFTLIDQDLVTTEMLRALPQSSAVCLGLIRSLIKDAENEKAKVEVYHYFDNFGYCEEISWYAKFLGVEPRLES